MQPVCGHVSYLLQAVEDVAIEYLGTVGFVESFDIGVLCRFTGLDVLQGNALFLRPLSQGMGYELRAVVQAN